MSENRAGWSDYDVSVAGNLRRGDGGGRSPAVPSPCIQVCQLNADGLCIGCRRRMDEIVAWPRMDREQKLAVLKELPHREI